MGVVVEGGVARAGIAVAEAVENKPYAADGAAVAVETEMIDSLDVSWGTVTPRALRRAFRRVMIEAISGRCSGVIVQQSSIMAWISRGHSGAI